MNDYGFLARRHG